MTEQRTDIRLEWWRVCDRMYRYRIVLAANKQTVVTPEEIYAARGKMLTLASKVYGGVEMIQIPAPTPGRML